MKEPIYVDHAATSPVHPSVAESMLPYMTTVFGNPSSIHSFGRKSRQVIDQARESIAKLIGAKESEIIFTSGGTEADNMAIVGVATANQHKGKHIITTSIEHHAVLHTCQTLEKQGFEVTYLSVNEAGVIDLNELKNAMRTDTILVTVMFGNNEVGTLQPIEEIAALLTEYDVYFHSDAVQAYGSVPIRVDQLKVDLLSVSAHKINGPKGVGFLYVREGTKLNPLTFGGEQERKRRAGTENVPGIVGLMNAMKISQSELQSKQIRFQEFQELFIQTLDEHQINYEINGKNAKRLPHILNLYFPGINIESFLVNLDLAGVAASSGSACTAGSIEPSHVLCALFGTESERTKASIRYSFGLGNTKEQIQIVAEETANIVKRLTRR
ncbi:cysteine desulfurase family protein [Bacillus salitolerans]|uniref:cysteine desulfurase n=1 Tax=Bacillus salitolerans TaxID=1437434 RepID=A0ABW4LNE4_9BACI